MAHETRRRGVTRLVSLAVGAAVFLILLFWHTPSVWAQEASTQNTPSTEMENPDGVFAAPVVIDGKTLFLVRGSSALPAHDRAAAI
ncbi:hypothetical protein [Sulfitobacter sp. TBRI5]|uniref:hypothetical protein n=1 Tax=Sulfitobacter sp. TBRI5 TaxID=2989732 RepID=UPI003D9AFE7D